MEAWEGIVATMIGAFIKLLQVQENTSKHQKCNKINHFERCGAISIVKFLYLMIVPGRD